MIELERIVTPGAEARREVVVTPELNVRAAARVVEVTERIVRFECFAHDGIETIGDGFHERAPVELARFVERVASKAGQAQQEKPHEQP